MRPAAALALLLSLAAGRGFAAVVELPALPAAAAPVPDGGGTIPAAKAPPRLVFLGPPGAGKTYMSNRLAAETGMVAVSAGQLLRDYARSDPAVAEQMSRGELVPTALVARLVRERLAREDARRLGFILDGFPRRLEEVEEFERSFGADAALDAVVLLRPSDEELQRRVAARGRADDSPEVFAQRLRIYDQRTLPAIERLRAKVPVLEPDLSAPDKDTNYSRLRALLAPWLGARLAD